MSISRLEKDSIEKIFGEGSAVVWIPDSPCENCGREVIDHDWVDMDDIGIIVNCSMEPNPLPYEEVLDADERRGD